MNEHQNELRTLAIPLCRSLIGAFTFPLTVFALQYYFRNEPVWLPVASNSQFPGYVLNQYYSLSNLAMSVGPLVGCLLSILFLPNCKFKSVGIRRYAIACVVGYYSMSFLGLLLKMKQGFHPYLLCSASWVMAIAICMGASRLSMSARPKGIS